MVLGNSRSFSRHSGMQSPWLVVALLCWVGPLSCIGPLEIRVCSADELTVEPAVPSELRTVAEQSEYQETANYAELLQFCKQLAESSPLVRHLSLGNSAEGRAIPALVLSQTAPAISVGTEAGLTLESSLRSSDDSRLVVLLVGGLHGDECEATETLLATLRDLAQSPDADWPEQLILVAVPRVNVDGGERRGAYHRPEASVPSHVGRKVNAQEIDLAQDFLALRGVESRRLTRLLHHWQPDLVITLRTSPDRQLGTSLLVSTPRHPAIPEPLRTWLRETAQPQLRQIVDDAAPAPRAVEVRPSQWMEYVAIRGIASLTAEVGLHLPYAERIRTGRRFLEGALDWSVLQKEGLLDTRRQTSVRTIQAATAPIVGDNISLAVAWEQVEAEANKEEGSAQAESSGKLRTTHSVQRPFAYLIPFEQSRLADRLLMHGFQLARIAEPVTIPVESYRLTKLQRGPVNSKASGGAAGRKSHFECEVETTEHDELVAARTYVVTLEQTLGNLAPLLLEPQSSEGWLAGGLLQGLVERAGDIFPVRRVPSHVEPWSLEDVEEVIPAERLTLDMIYGTTRRRSFGPTLPTIHWLPEENSYLRKIDEHWMRVSADSGAVAPWYDPSSVAQSLTQSALLSEKTAQELAAQLGRHAPRQLSSQGDAVVLSHAKDLYYVRLDGTRARRLTSSPSEERHATFSPDGKRVAFVRDYNLFVVDVSSGLERPLTVEGNENHLFGELDWVYQEEIYGRGEFRGFWWSPDSQRLAFLTLDQTPVHRHAIADHIPFEQTLGITPYPKAGASLPSARLAVVEAAGGDLVWVQLPRQGIEDLLIVRVGWTPDSESVVYQLQGREQNWLELLRADAREGSSKRLLREESDAWVDVLEQPEWLEDGAFLWISQRDGHGRLYRVSSDDQEPLPLTPRSLEIRHWHGVDPAGKHAYFTALGEEALSEQVYFVELETGSLRQISADEGFHAVQFSHDFQFFVDTVSQVHQTPAMHVRRTGGNFQHSIVPRQDDDLRYFELAKPEFHRVRARDGTLLEGMLIRPAQWDPRRKYPVLCYVYGGPQAPTVRDRWSGTNYLWHQLLAQRGFCVWLCDNRAASQRGVRSAWPIHGRLGEVELQDVEDGIAWLGQQPWCDGDRLGMWGWSYGGYLTSYAMTHSRLFRAGIAGAPVTDWHNYDAVYTERLMRMPQNNPEGYRSSSAVLAAGQLHGRILLIHGDADDNVHLGNSLQLAHALQKEGKPFDMMIYPRSLHGVTQPQQLLHLRQMMTDFLERHLAATNE
jgi:dipeptidyl-peptidase 4